MQTINREGAASTSPAAPPATSPLSMRSSSSCTDQISTLWIDAAAGPRCSAWSSLAAAEVACAAPGVLCARARISWFPLRVRISSKRPSSFLRMANGLRVQASAFSFSLSASLNFTPDMISPALSLSFSAPL